MNAYKDHYIEMEEQGWSLFMITHETSKLDSWWSSTDMKKWGVILFGNIAEEGPKKTS